MTFVTERVLILIPKDPLSDPVLFKCMGAGSTPNRDIAMVPHPFGCNTFGLSDILVLAFLKSILRSWACWRDFSLNML